MNKQLKKVIKSDKKAVSIATVLNRHKNEIYAFLESPEQFDDLKAFINKLLDSEELAENISAKKAKLNINKWAHKYNTYLTTLVTYMTCLPVSLYNKDN